MTNDAQGISLASPGALRTLAEHVEQESLPRLTRATRVGFDRAYRIAETLEPSSELRRLVREANSAEQLGALWPAAYLQVERGVDKFQELDLSERQLLIDLLTAQVDDLSAGAPITVVVARAKDIARLVASERGRLLATAEGMAVSDESSASDALVFRQLELLDWLVSLALADFASRTVDVSHERTGEAQSFVKLSLADKPPLDCQRTLASYAEPLLEVAERALHDGTWTDDPLREQRVARDVNFLRGELYETDPEDWLGPALGKIIARLERDLLATVPASQLSQSTSELVRTIISAVEADDPGPVYAASEAASQAIDWRHPTPEWLAAEPEFFAFIDEPGGPRRLFDRWMGWLRSGESDIARTVVGGSVEGTAPGAAGGSLVGFIVAALTDATASTSVTVGTGAGVLIGAILGAAIAYLSAAWHRED